MYDYLAKLVAVVDGDTIDIVRDAGCDILQPMRIRLDRINAPEMSTPEGKTAKSWLVKLLSNPDGTLKDIYICTMKDKKEKYGRYLGEFWLWSEDPARINSVNDRLVEAGHAKYQTY
jgi:micrococcal nuclease